VLGRHVQQAAFGGPDGGIGGLLRHLGFGEELGVEVFGGDLPEVPDDGLGPTTRNAIPLATVRFPSGKVKPSRV
jgi:hypothetical protein